MSPAAPEHATIGLLLSGGLDSSILLGHLLKQGYGVQPFYVRSGLAWQEWELAAAREFLDATRCRCTPDLVVLDLPLADVYGDHWSIRGEDVPDASSPDTAVYLPGRNALLAIKPVIWCHLHGIAALALAVLGSSPFADATEEFLTEFGAALQRALGARVRLLRPFGTLDKREVMRLGRDLPLGLTFSCIAPVDGLHCGRCNKCAERKNAFRLIETEDPTQYADVPRLA